MAPGFRVTEVPVAPQTQTLGLQGSDLSLCHTALAPGSSLEPGFQARLPPPPFLSLYGLLKESISLEPGGFFLVLAGSKTLGKPSLSLHFLPCRTEGTSAIGL